MNKLIKKALAYQASDIHLALNMPVVLRVLGEIIFLEQQVVDKEYLASLYKQILNSSQQAVLNKQGEIDFSWETADRTRLRINIYKQQGELAIAIRILPATVPNFKELGIPAIIEKLALSENGLVLITGPTGSGKSTTLAAIINYINENCKKHIISLEDPIEYLHSNKLSLISQRSVYNDTQTFTSGLKAALRQDPDVILVGELRDLETIATALTAAETGHLVLASLHTPNATQTINRIVDIFPSARQEQIKLQLSFTLRGIMAQKLLPGRDKQKLFLASEIVVINTAIRNLIRAGKTEQINAFIQTSETPGMCSLEKSLQSLYSQNLVEFAELIRHTERPELLKKI